MFAVIRFGQFCQCFGNFFCTLSHKEGEGSKNIKKAASMFSVYPLHRWDCVKKCLLGQISLLVVCQTKFGRFADACNILLPLSENIRKAASKFSVYPLRRWDCVKKCFALLERSGIFLLNLQTGFRCLFLKMKQYSCTNLKISISINIIIIILIFGTKRTVMWPRLFWNGGGLAKRLISLISLKSLIYLISGWKILISLISLISGLRKGWWCVVGATGDWLINATTLPHLGKTVSVWKFYTGHDSGIGNVRVYGAKRDGKTNMIHGTPSRKDFQARIMARLARFLDPWLRVGICTYIFVGWVKMVMF